MLGVVDYLLQKMTPQNQYSITMLVFFESEQLFNYKTEKHREGGALESVKPPVS